MVKKNSDIYRFLNIEFEKILNRSLHLGQLSLEKDNKGNYIDKNTQYAWKQYLKINAPRTID